MIVVAAMAALAADVDPFEPAVGFAGGQGSPHGEGGALGGGPIVGVSAALTQDALGRGLDGAVTAQAPVTVLAAWTLPTRMRLDVALPVYAVVDAPLTGFMGPALGDVRLAALLPISKGRNTAVALHPRVFLPTGTAAALTARGPSGGLTAVASGRAGALGWLGNAGLLLAEDAVVAADRPLLGSAAEGLASAWLHAGPTFRLGVETNAALGLVGGSGHRNVAWSAHGFAQNRVPSGFSLAGGGGAGLVSGIGSPAWRAFVSAGYTPQRRDQDGDGIADRDDACPRQPEDRDDHEDDDGCPDPDNDGDGIPDVVDQCDGLAEDFDGHEDEDGCPDIDNDGDGVVDGVDRCPDRPGPPAFSGCPDQDADGVGDFEDQCPTEPGTVDGCPDRDGDGVADQRDACPDDPIPDTESPETSDGCPRTVWVSPRAIEIRQHVAFENGRTRLLPGSHAALDRVVVALKEHPEIRKLEVQGHTDNVGSELYNRRLSQGRAQAVVDYLVSKGIDRSRLVARGYGETKPRFTNRTARGRLSNRRVEFVILERV